MATNQSDILAATAEQQADGAMLVGFNGNDLLLANSTQTWTATLQPMNDSAVAGTVTATLAGDQLQVEILATGLEANQIHAMHIHGLTATAGAGAEVAAESDVAGTVSDTDADGFVEMAEAAQTIGPALLPLQVDGQYPVAGADGAVNVTLTFDIGELPDGADIRDLLPMDMRAVEIHGLTVAATEGLLTGGEVDGSAGYKASLPVAAAELVDAAPGATDAEGAVLRGDNGGDMLVGGATDDLLLGGAADDVLAGQAGDDQLVGGSGRDVFVVGDGNDIIVDFETNLDKLVFSDGTGANGVEAANTTEGMVLTAGAATIMLVGVQTDAATLDLSDWVA
jgi:Ca2+-binding RTX toxin-like protein